MSVSNYALTVRESAIILVTAVASMMATFIVVSPREERQEDTTPSVIQDTPVQNTPLDSQLPDSCKCDCPNKKRSEASLQEILESLPQYPRVLLTETADAGYFEHTGRFFLDYWTNDAPEDVIAFYVTELPPRGWVMEQAPTTTLGHPLTISREGDVIERLPPSTSVIFVQDDIRLKAISHKKIKVPERGETKVRVNAEYR